MIESADMAEFTFQREWVEKRGLLLVLAFFLGGLGGGLYLVSLYSEFHAGLVTGFLIVALGKSSTHLAYLGKPWRFWRGFSRVRTSWISRGLVALSIFLLFGGMQLAPTLPILSWLPWSPDNALIQLLAIFGAVALIGYSGFVLGTVNAIPFWNTALMPLLFVVYSLLGGTGLSLGLLLATGNTAIDVAPLEIFAQVMLITAAVIVGTYLWMGYHAGPASKKSVVLLLSGRVSPFFVVGVVVLGVLVPFSTVGYALLHDVPTVVSTAVVGCELVGGLALRYSILKAGIYGPLI